MRRSAFQSKLIRVGGVEARLRPNEREEPETIEVTGEPMSKKASVVVPFGSKLPASPNPVAADPGTIMTTWPEYLVDAFQRSVLFLDLLRQRGNEEIEITSRPMATVLRFDHQVLMSGLSFPRPINFALSRIVPPDGRRDRSAQTPGCRG